MNPLTLLLLALPLLEIATLVEVGAWIGAGPTVALVVLSAVLGASVLRRQGMAVLRRAREAAGRDEPPVGALFDGLCVVIASVLLIIPGFLTDIVALMLFIPWVRLGFGRWLIGRLMRHGDVRMWVNGRVVTPRTPPAGPPPAPGAAFGPGSRPGQVIDGEYTEVDGMATDGEATDDVPKLAASRWGQRDAMPKGQEDGENKGDGRR
jgi:UPF0716 protein FxsA